ncbi:hypothetical protein FRC07_007607, partial [Ceratobasidium sp. 392]
MPLFSPRPQQPPIGRLTPNHAAPATAGPWTTTQPEPLINRSLGQSGGRNVLGQPNGLLQVSTQPPYEEQAATMVRVANQCDARRPLFLPESPPLREPPTQVPNDYSRGVTYTSPPISVPASPVALPVNATVAPLPIRTAQAITQQPLSRQLSAGSYDLDTELWAAAYGAPLADTGFQQCESVPTEGLRNKPKTTRSPRSPKTTLPPGTKWGGGPGGPLKFNAKPDNYEEDVGRLSRWSYSEDGTTSQDPNERVEGDVHFSPTSPYNEESFMSW